MASWPMVYNSLPGYAGFTSFTPTIPKLYWDVYSQEERIKRICMELHKLCEYTTAMSVNINLNHAMIEQLREEFEKFKETGFFDYYAEQLENWINDNVAFLFEKFAKQVFFGITIDGYFCAYVPDSWSEIEFDTGAVFNRYDYGRLILRYNADGSGVIDNTGRYDDSNTNAILERLALLESRVFRNENTLYTNLNG